jgi:hypothetical protein
VLIIVVRQWSKHPSLAKKTKNYYQKNNLFDYNNFMKTNNKVDAVQTSKAPLPEEEAQKAVQECSSAINELLVKYKCKLSCVEVKIDGQAQPVQIITVPIPPEETKADED